ncbi:MAG: NUDIX domain-containing protein [Mycoplasmataceae bacterium]|jgi:8-oxo-dGTP pyrophosphatase MutT (NUDIX family)|nr:NUDIX domain-containing protein [Mycoplasmataceae bacterium]
MSAKEYSRYLSSVQLYLFKREGDKTFVLLQLRKGGWGDNMWDASASGHIDHGETPTEAAQHEAVEEITVNVKTNDMKFISVINKRVNEDEIYYNFSFYSTQWTGTPNVNEPEKLYEIKWFDVKKLPKNMIADRKIAIKNYLNKISYGEIKEY